MKFDHWFSGLISIAFLIRVQSDAISDLQLGEHVENKCGLDFKEIPVCGTNGIENLLFPNNCQLNAAIHGRKDLKKTSLRTCLKGCSLACIDIDEPVCTRNPKNNSMRKFKNLCESVKDACVKDIDWQLIGEGECPQSSSAMKPKPCEKTFNPVCAILSGVKATFSNECSVKAENAQNDKAWKIIYKGICSEDTSRNPFQRPKYRRFPARSEREARYRDFDPKIEIGSEFEYIRAPSVFSTQFIKGENQDINNLKPTKVMTEEIHLGPKHSMIPEFLFASDANRGYQTSFPQEVHPSPTWRQRNSFPNYQREEYYSDLELRDMFKLLHESHLPSPPALGNENSDSGPSLNSEQSQYDPRHVSLQSAHQSPLNFQKQYDPNGAFEKPAILLSGESEKSEHPVVKDRYDSSLPSAKSDITSGISEGHNQYQPRTPFANSEISTPNINENSQYDPSLPATKADLINSPLQSPLATSPEPLERSKLPELQVDPRRTSQMFPDSSSTAQQMEENRQYTPNESQSVNDPNGPSPASSSALETQQYRRDGPLGESRQLQSQYNQQISLAKPELGSPFESASSIKDESDRFPYRDQSERLMLPEIQYEPSESLQNPAASSQLTPQPSMMREKLQYPTKSVLPEEEKNGRSSLETSVTSGLPDRHILYDPRGALPNSEASRHLYPQQMMKDGNQYSYEGTPAKSTFTRVASERPTSVKNENAQFTFNGSPEKEVHSEVQPKPYEVKSPFLNSVTSSPSLSSQIGNKNPKYFLNDSPTKITPNPYEPMPSPKSASLIGLNPPFEIVNQNNRYSFSRSKPKSSLPDGQIRGEPTSISLGLPELSTRYEQRKPSLLEKPSRRLFPAPNKNEIHHFTLTTPQRKLTTLNKQKKYQPSIFGLTPAIKNQKNPYTFNKPQPKLPPNLYGQGQLYPKSVITSPSMQPPSIMNENHQYTFSRNQLSPKLMQPSEENSPQSSEMTSEPSLRLGPPNQYDQSQLYPKSVITSPSMQPPSIMNENHQYTFSRNQLSPKLMQPSEENPPQPSEMASEPSLPLGPPNQYGQSQLSPKSVITSPLMQPSFIRNENNRYTFSVTAPKSAHSSEQSAPVLESSIPSELLNQHDHSQPPSIMNENNRYTFSRTAPSPKSMQPQEYNLHEQSVTTLESSLPSELPEPNYQDNPRRPSPNLETSNHLNPPAVIRENNPHTFVKKTPIPIFHQPQSGYEVIEPSPKTEVPSPYINTISPTNPQKPSSRSSLPQLQIINENTKNVRNGQSSSSAPPHNRQFKINCELGTNPICGTYQGNKHTFKNPCELNQHNKLTGEDWHILHENACNYCDFNCPDIEDPVCVTRNGIPYTIPNECILRSLMCKNTNGAWKLLNRGICPAREKQNIVEYSTEAPGFPFTSNYGGPFATEKSNENEGQQIITDYVEQTTMANSNLATQTEKSEENHNLPKDSVRESEYSQIPQESEEALDSFIKSMPTERKSGTRKNEFKQISSTSRVLASFRNQTISLDDIDDEVVFELKFRDSTPSLENKKPYEDSKDFPTSTFQPFLQQ